MSKICEIITSFKMDDVESTLQYSKVKEPSGCGCDQSIKDLEKGREEAIGEGCTGKEQENAAEGIHSASMWKL